MPLILWDIDHTLVHCGPAGQQVFDTAVVAALGRHPGAHGVRMGGKTDPQIAREILAHLAVEESARDEALPGVLTALEQAMAEAAPRIATDGHALPGAAAVLRRLAAIDHDPPVVQTVLTGNIKPNARLKLAAFDLDRHLDLDVGAYGSDSAVRADLVPVARRRAAERYGRPFPPEDTWVVGDTPLDLACARAGGVRCLLVATGFHPLDELVTAGADLVLPDLDDTDTVVRLLLGE